MNKDNKNKYFKIKIAVNIITISILLYAFVYLFKVYFKTLSGNCISEIWLACTVIFFLIYHLSVFLHEIGHTVALKIFGYEVKLFKAGPAKYIKDTSGNKIVFNKSGLFLGDGYVIPGVNKSIYDEDSFNDFAKKYIYFIYSGIVVTIIIMIVCSILVIFKKAVYIDALILIINWLILLKSFNNENLKFGDFYIIEMLKSNPDYISLILQNNLAIEYPLNSFLINKIENYLMDLIEKEEKNELILGLADKVIDEYIIEGKVLSQELDKLKIWTFNNYIQKNNNDLVLMISIIKLSYKFLLHEYSLKMKEDFKYDYTMINEYLMQHEKLTKYEIVKRMVNTLKFLSNGGNMLTADFKYLISDTIFLAGECDNYKEKVQLIMNKLC